MCSYESGPKTHGLFDVREHLKLRSTEHSATFARVLHECTAEATAEAFHVLLTQDWTIWLARCLWYVTFKRIFPGISQNFNSNCFGNRDIKIFIFQKKLRNFVEILQNSDTKLRRICFFKCML